MCTIVLLMNTMSSRQTPTAVPCTLGRRLVDVRAENRPTSAQSASADRMPRRSCLAAGLRPILSSWPGQLRRQGRRLRPVLGKCPTKLQRPHCESCTQPQDLPCSDQSAFFCHLLDDAYDWNPKTSHDGIETMMSAVTCDEREVPTTRLQAQEGCTMVLVELRPRLFVGGFVGLLSFEFE
jgi:hypothetical protein